MPLRWRRALQHLRRAGASVAVCLSLALGQAATAQEAAATAAKAEPQKAGGERAAPVTVEQPRLPSILPLTTRAPRPYTDYEASRGLRFGNLTLFPEATEAISYSDNIFGVPDASRAKHGDFLLEHSPGMGLVYTPTKGVDLAARYVFGWHDYLDDVAIDYLTHDANLDLRLTDVLLRGLEVRVSEDYSQSGNTAVLEDEFQSFTRVQGNNLGVNFTYTRNKLQVISGYQWGFTDYFSRELQHRDMNTHTVPLIVSYKVSERLVPYVSYKYVGSRFLSGNEQNSDANTVEGGVRLSPGGRLVLDLATGYSRKDMQGGNGGGNEGMLLRADANYSFGERMRIWASGFHGPVPGVSVPYSRSLEFELGGEFWPIRRLAVEPSILWRRDCRKGGAEQATLSASLRFRYYIRRYLYVLASLDRSERCSNRADDVHINHGYLGLRFRF